MSRRYCNILFRMVHVKRMESAKGNWRFCIIWMTFQVIILIILNPSLMKYLSTVCKSNHPVLKHILNEYFTEMTTKTLICKNQSHKK